MSHDGKIRLRHIRTVWGASASDASYCGGSTSSCASTSSLKAPAPNPYPSAQSSTGLTHSGTAESEDRDICGCVTSSQPKKRLRTEATQPPSDHRRTGPVIMAHLRRCILHVHVGGNGCVETHSARKISEAPVVAVSPAESKRELLPGADDWDGVGTPQQLPSCLSHLGEPRDVRSSFEAVLSAFPFLLPIVEGKSVLPTSRAVLSAGTPVRTEDDQPCHILEAAVEGLSEVAADLAVEMGELRRSGEQLAESLPGGSFASCVRSSDVTNCSNTAICSRVGGGNSPGRFTGEGRSFPLTYLCCDCVASVTASVESSVLSVLYEKEALHLFEQDVLDTKFQWWRAVKTCFARQGQLATSNAASSVHSRQKCCLPAGEISAREIEKHQLLELDTAIENDNSHPPLQRWAGFCLCSPVSLAYLLKAHEQLYYMRDKAPVPLPQAPGCCTVAGLGNDDAGEMPTYDSAADLFVKTGETKLRDCTGAQKLAHPVTFDHFADSLKALRRPVASAVYEGYRSDHREGRQTCGFQSDTEKRRRIWQWLWEAAGALGFCASSRFLAMQLLDAYLQHEKCMVDVSKTTQLATAAVAAVLLAAASRCHWRDVKNDAFLLALLRQLQLPSTADDVIKTQADMLRLLPTFLFTVRSPVDYLMCFLANLRWLPQVLEHSSSRELKCNQEERGAGFARNGSTDAKGLVSQEGSSTQARALRQHFHSISVGLQRGEEQAPGGGYEASMQPGDVQQRHTQPEKNFASEGLTSGTCCLDAATSLARDVCPVLVTCTASHAVTPAKRMVSLFDYWRCTGLLGCLEGLMLRCCSAFVASATLCARVPMSRVLAVLLLQVFEPYSRYRLQHPQETTRGVLSKRNAGDVKVNPRTVSKERPEKVSCFVPSVVGSWPAGLLEWCRCISTNVFRMHFDADLLFWKLLLQPLIDQLLHLPENRPFLLLWQRGVKEWALLLDSCSRAFRRNKADGAEGSNMISFSCPPAKVSFSREVTSSVGQRYLAEEGERAAASPPDSVWVQR